MLCLFLVLFLDQPLEWYSTICRFAPTAQPDGLEIPLVSRARSNVHVFSLDIYER